MRVYEHFIQTLFYQFSGVPSAAEYSVLPLLSSNAERIILAARPLKLALFQSLVEQEKTVAFPVERFDSVGSSAAEQEQRVGTRVKPELLFNDGCQSIDPTAKIGALNMI